MPSAVSKACGSISTKPSSQPSKSGDKIRSQPIDFESGAWWALEPEILPDRVWTETSMMKAGQDLINCIQEDRHPRCNGRDGRAAIEIVMAIYESERRNNCWVDLPIGVQESLVDVLRAEGKL